MRLIMAIAFISVIIPSTSMAALKWSQPKIVEEIQSFGNPNTNVLYVSFGSAENKFNPANCGNLGKDMRMHKNVTSKEMVTALHISYALQVPVKVRIDDDPALCGPSGMPMIMGVRLQ